MYKLKEDLSIENMIYEIRGRQVMLDCDLAKLYNVETKRINEAVKNNPDKFPERFYFRINENEFFSLKSKISTSKGGSRKGHNVFTEQGIAMLSTILKSKVAVETSIRIMDAFVKMRKYISANLIEQDNMKNMLIKHDNEIKLLQESFSKLEEKEKINHIFYDGQIYDAYSLLIDIFKGAKEEIIIIDNYADKSILNMITNLNVKVTIVTRKFNLLKDIDIKKYNRQYHNLKVIYSDKFHDRFIILDKKVLYHSGASY
ncbi:oRF6N domain [Clostridium sp. CAG:433]|nr:oRF6N domain [Clostridium sp. CAG:433]